MPTSVTHTSSIQKLCVKLINAYGSLVPNGYNICGGGERPVATLEGEKSYWFGKKRDPDSVERSRINNSGANNKITAKLAHNTVRLTLSGCNFL
jgi:hypothetical protein